MIPAALVLTADLIFLQVSSIFTINIRIGSKEKLNSRLSTLLFYLPALCHFFPYVTFFLFVCLFVIFLIRKVERREGNVSYFRSFILLVRLGWRGRIIMFCWTKEQQKDCVHTAIAVAEQDFEVTTRREPFSWRGFFKTVFDFELWYLEV